MLRRFGETGRLIPPDLARPIGDGPKRTYLSLKEKGELAGYAEIDNSGPGNRPRIVTEDDAGILSDIEF